MAQRSSSKNGALRRSTNDLYDSNDSRFKTVYAQAFQDHMRKMTGADLQGLAAAQTQTVTSPANKNMAPIPRPSASRGGNRASLNGGEKPPLSSAAKNHMTPDPKR